MYRCQLVRQQQIHREVHLIAVVADAAGFLLRDVACVRGSAVDVSADPADRCLSSAAIEDRAAHQQLASAAGSCQIADVVDFLMAGFPAADSRVAGLAVVQNRQLPVDSFSWPVVCSASIHGLSSMCLIRVVSSRYPKNY